VSDHRPEIGEVFGESIPTYPPGVPWRLEGLLRRYLADPGERARLAGLARERVQRHTFAQRAAAVIEAIEQHDRARHAVAA
jgi:hypothetical protein